jgi:outer membrane beta-barrel protein
MPRLVVVLVLLGVVTAGPSYAQERPEDYAAILDVLDEGPPQQGVIQKRQYDLVHELTLLTGVLPADPYYKGYTVGASYTFHVNHVWGWEIGQFNWSFNRNTKLRDEVRRIAAANQSARPIFRKLQWHGASRLVFKPLYGKQAVFNTKIVHIEGFLAAGPGMSQMTGPGTPVTYGIDASFGMRLWMTDVFSMLVDLGQYTHWFNGGTWQALHLHLGFAFNLRGEE